MENKMILTALIILSYINTDAQNLDWKSLEVKSDTDLLKTVVYIQSNIKPIDEDQWRKGTGFLYYSILKSKLYLITNRHAVKKENFIGDTLMLSIQGKNKPNYDRRTTFSIGNLQQRYLSFPGSLKDENDVVLIDLFAISFDVTKYDIKVFTERNIPDNIFEKTIALDSKIFMIGYPMGVSAVSIPMFIPCTLATPYYIDYLNSKEFCINGNVVGGCSGSPIVYRNNDKKYFLLGLERFGVTQPRQVFNSTSNIEIDSLTYMHEIFINLCIKSKKILELISQN